MAFVYHPAGSAIFSTVASKALGIVQGQLNEMFVLVMHCEKNSVLSKITSITDPKGLTWQRRSQFNWNGSGSRINNMEVWWAFSPTILGSYNITVNLDNATDDGTLTCMAIEGVDPINPWDSNAGLPFRTTDISGTATQAHVTASTNSSSSFMFAAWASGDSPSGTTPNPMSGWTVDKRQANTGGTNVSLLMTEYLIQSAAQTNLDVTTDATTHTFWSMMVDALAPPAGGGGAGTARAMIIG